MFFLLRCVFWLGLVFANMDWTVGEPLLPSGDQVAKQATSQCLAHAAVCAQVVAGAQKLYTASMGEPAAPASSVDTLNSSDRSPAWQGPKP